MVNLNKTHDAARQSWVESANGAGDFPIQNLPFGVFRRAGGTPRGGIAIGDQIFDLAAAVKAALFVGDAAVAAEAAAGATLNALMALGNGPASALRAALFELLSAGSAESERVRSRAGEFLVPMSAADLLLPAEIGAFTDMMISTFHVGGNRHGAARREPPGKFKYIPLGYNSRASSVVISGTPVVRPRGVFDGEDGKPVYAPEPRQDFELEVAAFIGTGNALGTTIPIGAAADHIFGYCLLNDWSSRAIQMFEMPPLGPFLGKSLSTTISPWIVTGEALAPFRTAAFTRPEGDPAPLPHLTDASDQQTGGFDLKLEAWLSTPTMRERNEGPERITDTNFKYMYWTFAQLITHHASNGCNLRAGDLVASGTTSGPTDETCGCLLEQTVNGTVPMVLRNGESRRFLEDGDEVTFRGRAERDGFATIGFGACSGRLLPVATAR